jgi:hypothetical protein
LQLVAHCHTYENTLAICRQNCKGRWLVPFSAMENEKKTAGEGSLFFQFGIQLRRDGTLRGQAWRMN